MTKNKDKPPEHKIILAVLVFALVLSSIFLVRDGDIKRDWEDLFSQYNISQGVYLSGNPIVYLVKSRVRATITGYSSEVAQTDSTPFITASGKKVRAGIIACPIKYPFGTIVRFDDEYHICEDRMNQIKHPEKFDKWFSEKSEALEFGVQKKVVEIIK